jgi:hypothetical protein
VAFSLQVAGPAYSQSTKAQIDYCLGTVSTGPYGDTRAQRLKSCVLGAIGLPRSISIDILRESGFICSQNPARCKLATSTYSPRASIFAPSLRLDWVLEITLKRGNVVISSMKLHYERDKPGSDFHVLWSSDSTLP